MMLGSRKPLAETAGEIKSRSPERVKKKEYKLAILRDPHDAETPSDEEAIHQFIRAGYQVNIDVSVIGCQDADLLPTFDGLFIRNTTSVNHYTYDFARQARAHGLIVIDDPQSIVRGSNKVYQAKLFQRDGIPSPRTIILPHNQPIKAGCLLGWPLVLKTSDGHSSLGVSRANTQSDLDECLWRLPQSGCELILAQQFISSSFDWRIGVLAGRALYACRYYMVPGYWKIRDTESVGNKGYGRVETFAVEAVPPRLIAIAERAARLIGNGLYGVDVKELSGEFFVIEVNDNPTIDAGVEDDVLGEHLYLAVMKLFRERIVSRAVFWRQLDC